MSTMQKSVTASTAKMSTAIGTLKTAMASLGVVFGTYAVVQFGKSCINAASDLQEVQNVVDVTFGSMSDQVNNFSKNAIESFGLSEYAAKKYASTMGAMLKSSGINEGVADLSISITELTADMASFYNLGTDEAFQKIQSGISGETEPLKRLGINMSVANVQAYALSQGITKSYQSMSQAEQVMLRYNYLLATTKDAQGDFARTSNSWANQTKVLAMRFEELKTQLGQGLINALTPALRMLNSIVAALTTVASYWNALTAAIFGKQAAVASASADSAADAADAENGYADAVTAAGKAAKSNLASFDKLNVLQQDTSGGSGSDAANIPTVDVSEKDTGSGIADKIAEIKEKLSGIDFSKVKNALQGLKDAITPFAQGAWDGLKDLFETVLVPLAKLTIENVLPVLITALAVAFTGLTAALNVAKPLIIGVVAAFALWKTIQFANYVMYIGALTHTTGWAALGNAISQVVFVGLSPLKTALIGAVASMKTMIVTIGLQIKNFALLLLELAKQAIAWVAYQVKVAASAVAQLAMNAATAAWSAICSVATAVTTAFGAAVAFLTSPIGLVVIAVGALIAIVVLLVKHWDEVKEAAKNVWDGIVSTFSKAASWFDDKVIKPISNGFKNFINGAIGMFESFVNFFIRGINKVVDALNMMSFTVPDWVPGIGGEMFGFNIPNVAEMSLPRLANGGIATSSVLANIGESGKEAVLPLENNTGWMDELAKRIGGDVVIQASGGANLMKYLNIQIAKEGTRRGTSLVKGGAY